MSVQIPGSIVKAHMTCRNIPVRIHETLFPANFVVLGTKGIDVVLGMDWMSRYHGRIDCTLRTVELTSTDGVHLVYSDKPNQTTAICQASTSLPTLEEVSVVCEFTDVFPEELPGMPPDRDIEFVIELAPGTAPIAHETLPDEC